jgi:hypothetical protein
MTENLPAQHRPATVYSHKTLLVQRSFTICPLLHTVRGMGYVLEDRSPA